MLFGTVVDMFQTDAMDLASWSEAVYYYFKLFHSCG